MKDEWFINYFEKGFEEEEIQEETKICAEYFDCKYEDIQYSDKWNNWWKDEWNEEFNKWKYSLVIFQILSEDTYSSLIVYQDAKTNKLYIVYHGMEYECIYRTKK